MAKLARIDCRSCGTGFRPENRRIVRCVTCRGGDKPRKAAEYREKPCRVCLVEFQPDGPKVTRCRTHAEMDSGLMPLVMAYVETLPEDERRALADQPELCESCTMPVSGRARWGDSWGGECDRSEHRASALMARLSGSNTPSG